MLTRLARRFGLQRTMPLSAVEGWLLPEPCEPVALAPRGAAASVLVDPLGRIQPVGASWTLDWTLAAGARWVASLETERVTQRLLGPAVVETTIETPSGTVVHRVAAAVAGGEPVAIIELENQGGVAIAAGVAIRPVQIAGRGHLGDVALDEGGVVAGGHQILRFESAPAAGRVGNVDDGDLLASPPEATAGFKPASSSCRSGGAQAVAVWPLPHTATQRVVVPLGDAIRADAHVPAIDDVERGWRKHLDAGMRVDVGGIDLSDRLPVAARVLLTSWPEVQHTPSVIVALSELGFGDDVPRLLGDLERLDDDHAVLAAVARWTQLAGDVRHLDALDRVIGPVARAAHGAASARTSGPGWLGDALNALGDAIDMIEQPDVAERMRALASTVEVATDRERAYGIVNDGAADDIAMTPRSAASLVIAARSLIVDESNASVALLPELPIRWRGQTIDVLSMPLRDGNVSFGLRWHGSRPALLWEVDTPSPVQLSAPGIDPAFSTTEATGETLLADPGWPTK